MQQLVNNYEIEESEINNPIGLEDISFIPVITGAGGSVGRIIGGAALIGLTVATGGFGGAAIGTFGLGAGSIGVGTLAVGIGASMVLSGVSEMLFPLPNHKNLKMNKTLEFHLVLVAYSKVRGQVVATL